MWVTDEMNYCLTPKFRRRKYPYPQAICLTNMGFSR